MGGTTARVRGQSLPTGRPICLKVQDNQCQYVLPTPRADEKYFLILGSLSMNGGPCRVSIQTQAIEAKDEGRGTKDEIRGQASGARGQEVGVAFSSLTSDPRSLTPSSFLIHPSSVILHRSLSPKNKSVATSAKAEEVYSPAKQPARGRNFFLFVRERDFSNPESYVTVSGELQGVGRHCQVYVDRDFHPQSVIQPTIDDIIQTFDREVYPRACHDLGRALDVDRDGRFTILLTPWLGKLADGKVSLGGFVRGSDFFRDLAPPFGNRCDMMYLNTELQPGPALRTILAHEYTHAVIFSEHVFGSYQSQAPHQDEEGWLNEGLAHMIEDLREYSWSNLDYRISAFLSAPERYQLVVPDYFRSGLFRSHGHRGATYLFLRWCCDRFGEELLKSLVQTNLNGIANVEAATGQPFADLFREWTTALALSGSGLEVEESSPIRRITLHRPLAGRLLCGPRFEELSLNEDQREATLSGTSAAFFMLHSPTKSHTRLTITAEPEANLQVTLIRVPEHTARLTLCLEPQENLQVGLGSQTFHLKVTAFDQDVTLENAAWERLIPATNRPEDTSFRPSEETTNPTQNAVKSWFGDAHLKAGETRTSEPVTIPAGSASGESWVFKILASDPRGHHLSAWAVK
jgi:hypothetical protein